MPVIERNVSITEFYNADEVFMCGTVGEIVPVYEIDGKDIGEITPGQYTLYFSNEYKAITDEMGVSID